MATRTTEEVERYYAENPEQRGEPQPKPQTKLRKVGAIVGWALMFWIVSSIPVGIGLTLLGVDQTGRSAFYLAALILGGLYGAGYRLRRPRTT
jgi:hypothetical protein